VIGLVRKDVRVAVVTVGGDSVDDIDECGGVFGDKGFDESVRIRSVKIKERKRRGCGEGVRGKRMYTH